MKSGFVAVVGRPNVGKSTLVNAIVGSKVAITSSRPQTTRSVVRGILHDARGQIVFLDTPGQHRPRTELGSRLNRLAAGSVDEADAVVFVIDATAPIGPGDRRIATGLQGASTPVVVALNKVDAATADEIVTQLAEAGEWDFGAYAPVSAISGDGVSVVVDELFDVLPEGPAFFPEDMTTDQAEDVLIGEIVREKFLDRLRDELPHSLAVLVEEREIVDDVHHIHARLVVERDSQKGIVIGKGGAMLQEAGSEARQELEQLLEAKVFLDLRVKVEKEWQRRPHLLDRLGF